MIRYEYESFQKRTNAEMSSQAIFQLISLFEKTEDFQHNFNNKNLVDSSKSNEKLISSIDSINQPN